jgi:hypothetical protein
MSGNLFGTYGGTVENNQDPLKMGRLKVRVPHVYGASSTGGGWIGTNDLPWALPAGQPAGQTSNSGGLSSIPVPGDLVWVRFLDGEPEKPLWEWGAQTQKPALKLHSYGSDASPDRLILTRYGHSVEITATHVNLTTKEGQQVLLQTSKSEAGGAAAIQTPKGQKLVLNDLNKTAVLQALDTAVVSASSVIANAPTSTLVKTGRFTLMVGSALVTIQDDTILIATGTGATINVDDEGNVALNSGTGTSVSLEDSVLQLGTPDGTGIVIEDGKISINATNAVMNTAAFSVGVQLGYPVLMLTPQMLTWLIGHTHTNGNNGSPTGPPIPMGPGFPNDSASTRLQTS